MKKSLFLFLIIPLSMVAQKAKLASDVKPIVFKLNWADTLSFQDLIIKTDTSILLVEIVLKPNLGKPIVYDIPSTDTLSSSKKYGEVGFTVTEYPFNKWTILKNSISESTSTVIKEADRIRDEQAKNAQRERDKLKAIKNNKN